MHFEVTLASNDQSLDPFNSGIHVWRTNLHYYFDNVDELFLSVSGNDNVEHVFLRYRSDPYSISSSLIVQLAISQR
ncbi:hypothetical protein LTR85_001355 [Meristemomyces frigidus]|nr:hypothetical protein LTR85_001355 [Meristemomyces frigidus]